jgi:hypothetical protein
MAEGILSIRAECRSCGWLGMGSERKARGDALFCPRCAGQTKSWVVDQSKEMADLDRLREEWLEALMKSNQISQQSRLASERLAEAKAQVKRCQANLALHEVNDPGDARQQFELKKALLKAEGQAAAAQVACAQAKAQVKAQGR